MKVLLVEELAPRERLSLLFLRDQLVSSGFDVMISNSWRIETDIRDFKPDIVIDNISDSYAHYAGKLFGYKGRNINLVWEQLVTPYNIHRFRFNRGFVDNFVEGRISWGESFKEIFLSLNPSESSERIRVTGSMKHSITQIARSIEKRDAEELFGISFSEFEKVVVIADTFKAANANIFKENKGHPFIVEFNQMHTMYQRYLPKMCKELSSVYKDVLFIVRAHPHKSDDYYKEFSEQFENSLSNNVVIQSGGDLSLLMGVSDVLISHKSGTLIDASYTGINAINLVLKNDVYEKYNILPSPDDSFGIIADEDNIVDKLDLVLYGANQPSNMKVDEARVGATGRKVFKNISGFIQAIGDMECKNKHYPVKDVNYSLLKRILRNRTRYALKYSKTIHDEFCYEKAYDLLKNKML